MDIAAYGSWKSPISSDLIVKESIGLSAVRLDGQDVYWIELRPSEGGRHAVVRRTADGEIKTLTPREEKVLRMRFGIGEKSDHTLEEVGQDFEVTRERIRQIEAKALRKLRHPSRSKQLKSFIDS